MIPYSFPFFGIIAAYHLDIKKIPGKWVRIISFSIPTLVALGLMIFCFIKSYYLQSVVLLLCAAISIYMMKRRDNVLISGTIIILLVMTIFEHGMYYNRAMDRYDYIPSAKLLAAKLDPNIPIVINRHISYKMGFQLLGLVKKPMYMEKVHNYDNYQYITRAKWLFEDAETIMTIPFQGDPSQNIYLQIIKSDDIEL